MNNQIQSPRGPIGALILARMGSTRLPGKALMDLRGRPVIAYMVEKVRAMRHEARPIVTMTDRPYDDVLQEWCRREGVDCYRGDENDVLGRVASCARTFALGTIIRLNGDSPLLPVHVVDEVLDAYARSGCEYASNAIRRTYPYGASVEVLSSELLARLDREEADPLHREHVTLRVRQRPEEYRTCSVETPEADRGDGYSIALDRPEDAERIRRVLERSGKDHRRITYGELIVLLKLEGEKELLPRL